MADFGCDPRSSDSLRGVVFPKNPKIAHKIPHLATSGRHNAVMIMNVENSQPNGPHMGCLVSTFDVGINSKSLHCTGCTLCTRKGLTQIFRNVRCPILSNITLLCWCGLEP